MAIPYYSDLDLNKNKLINAKVDNPIEAKDIANKDYVDYYKCRVNLTGQCQITSYRRSVIALCEVSTTDKTNLNSYSSGTLHFHRINGLAGVSTIEFSIENRYDTAYQFNFSYLSNVTWNANADAGGTYKGFRPCVFKYNEKYYAGLEIYIADAELDTVNFIGASNFGIFALDYYQTKTNSSDSTPIILNQEVYDSLDFSKHILCNRIYYGLRETLESARLDDPTASGGIANKQYVDNKVLDGSTVPVGSIIGFEGDEIPDGYELIETTEDDTTTEETTKILTSADNVNRVYEEGRYLCYYGDLPSNLPENSTGVLEVISSGRIVDHCIQKYYLEESQTTYERHISEELGAWHKIITSEMYAVMTGTITMPAASSGTLTGYVEVSYPEGFTQSNCIVAGLMSHNTMNVGQWSTTMNSQDALSMMFGNGDLTAIFKSNVIRIMSNKTADSTTARDVTYKLVLMKLDF